MVVILKARSSNPTDSTINHNHLAMISMANLIETEVAIPIWQFPGRLNRERVIYHDLNATLGKTQEELLVVSGRLGALTIDNQTHFHATGRFLQ